MYMDSKEENMIGNFTLKFGKFKGQKFCDVDRDYLKWCLDKDVFADDKYKWNAAIRDYIKTLV